jgi:hypothetical protein
MREITCDLCDKPLTGGTDTFGWPGNLCWNCYAECNANGGDPELGDYYGLAPHHHDLSITGSLIGSTVFDPLPERDANGEYHIAAQQTFVPDPDVSGLGTWHYDTPLGWR